MNRQARGFLILGGAALALVGVELLFSTVVDAGPGVASLSAPASERVPAQVATQASAPVVRRVPRQRARATTKLVHERPGHGLPWNGGKPGIPVEVSSDMTGPIPPDADTPVVVGVSIDMACSAAGVQIRGIEGVVVVGENRFGLGPCSPTEEFQVPVRVRIPSGGAGFLAVDVEVEMANPDDGSTSRQRTSKAIQVLAMGVKFRPKSIGKAGVAAKPAPGAKAEPAAVVELGNGSNTR